ncbi:Helix-turn-helix domain-containing protein [Amycolatopsis arida]|uniref:Helix-turn-helix domain-containing protein n=1 Tax=Amycolatopsis arida TaxID=587909 RepID=A0A1I5WIQ3_9PSEU|nr:helix-turn-helix transcriptional regulator [Amycolatopsis arida]TDX92305.1 helix-turn-helix protein [Amycolatopsis arida]SFQ19595.1 Helix-turn-helix domain-containing protein [Amycolatopsis arida]
MADRFSDARRREVGDQLRKRRVAADLTLAQLSDRTGFSITKISRMESGLAGYSEVGITVHLAHCGQSSDDIAEVLHLGRETEEGYLVRRTPLSTLVLHENTARSFATAAPFVVPGLLQTEDYTRAIMHAMDDLDESEVAIRVQVRRDRQNLLYRWNAPKFTFYLCEGALRFKLGSNRMMNEQLLHLGFVAERPNVSIRVLPSSAGLGNLCGGHMTLMGFAAHGSVLFAETRVAGLFVENREDIASTRTFLGQLADEALDERQSREFLARVANDYDRPE